MTALDRQLQVESDLKKAFLYKKHSTNILHATRWLVDQLKQYPQNTSKIFQYRFLKEIDSEMSSNQRFSWQYDILCDFLIEVCEKLGEHEEAEKYAKFKYASGQDTVSQTEANSHLVNP